MEGARHGTGLRSIDRSLYCLIWDVAMVKLLIKQKSEFFPVSFCARGSRRKCTSIYACAQIHALNEYSYKKSRCCCCSAITIRSTYYDHSCKEHKNISSGTSYKEQERAVWMAYIVDFFSIVGGLRIYFQASFSSTAASVISSHC